MSNCMDNSDREGLSVANAAIRSDITKRLEGCRKLLEEAQTALIDTAKSLGIPNAGVVSEDTREIKSISDEVDALFTLSKRVSAGCRNIEIKIG